MLNFDWKKEEEAKDGGAEKRKEAIASGLEKLAKLEASRKNAQKRISQK